MVQSIRNVNPSTPTVSITGSIVEITIGTVDANDIAFSITNIKNPSFDNSNFFLLDTYDAEGFKIDFSDNRG